MLRTQKNRLIGGVSAYDFRNANSRPLILQRREHDSGLAWADQSQRQRDLLRSAGLDVSVMPITCPAHKPRNECTPRRVSVSTADLG